MTGPAERGFALLIVLWVLVFVAFLMTQIMGSGRTAVNLATNIRAAAIARAADDGAINLAVLHLLSPGTAHWAADGTNRAATIGATAVTLRIDGLTGRVNPNIASAALLAGLLQAVGTAPDAASAIAANIVAWRSAPASASAGAANAAAYRRAGLNYAPPGRPFATTGELTDVLGMTPDLYASLAPHLSLYQPADPDPAAADPYVKKALSLSGAGSSSAAYQGAPVVAITACAGAALCRRALVSLAGLGAPSPFSILALDGAAPGSVQ